MSMNHNNITILETRDKEFIEIQIDIEKRLQIKSEAKSKWEDWIFIKWLKRFIKFSNIKDERGKMQYISLPSPEIKPRDIKEMTEEERKNRKILLDKIWEETKEGRKKKFIEQRKDILKRLEVSEKRHWIQTTLNKLEELNVFRKKNIFKKNK